MFVCFFLLEELFFYDFFQFSSLEAQPLRYQKRFIQEFKFKGLSRTTYCVRLYVLIKDCVLAGGMLASSKSTIHHYSYYKLVKGHHCSFYSHLYHFTMLTV